MACAWVTAVVWGLPGFALGQVVPATPDAAGGASETNAAIEESIGSEVPDLGIVTEEELAPALDSNRQPLGPDPLEWPQWSAAEVEAMAAGRPVNLGGGLWSPERFPLQPVPAWPAAATTMATPASFGDVLGRESLGPYGASRAWCVDPQRVLPDWRRARLESLLEAHAATAVHPVRVWLLAPGQSVAPETDAGWLHQASFGPNNPGILGILAIDHPELGRWLVSPALAEAGMSGLRRAGDAANAESAALGQLEAQVVHQVLKAHQLPALRAAGVTIRPAVDAVPAPERSRLRWPTAVWVTAALALAALIAAALVRRRPAVTTSHPCLWLESDRPARLGGAHSGGVGASLEW